MSASVKSRRARLRANLTTSFVGVATVNVFDVPVLAGLKLVYIGSRRNSAALRKSLNLTGHPSWVYSVSTLVCTPDSLSQEVGTALGDQAGPARMAQIALDAGFSRFRQATEARSSQSAAVLCRIASPLL